MYIVTIKKDESNTLVILNFFAQDNRAYIQTGIKHPIKKNGTKPRLLMKNNENEKQTAVNNDRYLSKFKNLAHNFCAKKHAKKECNTNKPKQNLRVRTKLSASII